MKTGSVVAAALLGVMLAACSPGEKKAEAPAAPPAPPVAPAPPEPPAWAFAINPPLPPGEKPPPLDNVVKLKLEGSKGAYTAAGLRDFGNPPDWFPGDHPKMPPVVGHGRPKEGVLACGFCHLPGGSGRPENSGLSGLSADYIIEQMADLKSGARVTPNKKHGPSAGMNNIAKQATDAEIAEAAAYFSALKPVRHIEVIETDEAPITHVQDWVVTKTEGDGAGMEPIGERLLETPDTFENFRRRNERGRYVVYAPVGSVEKGAALAVAKRGPEKQSCAECHGEDFKGIGIAPHLAGRSPSYLMRQVYSFQIGTRNGPHADKMKPIVAGLTNADMVALGAYFASLEP